MALVTVDDLANEFLIRLYGSTAVAYYTDAIINAWINDATRFAASYKKWPFTEVKDTSLTFSAGTETYPYPAQIKTDSIRFLTVGTSPAYNLQKIDFQSYLKFRELQTNSDSARVFSDWIRVLYINPNLDVAGTITLYGQSNPTALDTTNRSAQTVFSGGEEEGNEAIVDLMISYAKMRERKIGESQFYMGLATNILESIWKKILDEQYAYQEKNRGMFTRTNILRGATQEEIFKRDQF